MKDFFLNGNAAFFYCLGLFIYSMWLHVTA
jgi:hypothetical protein